MRIFNPEGKFIPVDFQVARLLNYEIAEKYMKRVPNLYLIVNEDTYSGNLVYESFRNSGERAQSIWDAIDEYAEEVEEEGIVIPEFEQLETDAKKLGAKAYYMALHMTSRPKWTHAELVKEVMSTMRQERVKFDTYNYPPCYYGDTEPRKEYDVIGD